jgi:hypothetical protein
VGWGNWNVLALALLFSISGCSTFWPIRQSPPETPPEFAIYLADFEVQARLHGRNISTDIPVAFGDLSDREPENGDQVIGLCYFTPRHIVIDKSWWTKAPAWGKESLIFHELGHCVLDRDHRSGECAGRPCSIMRPIVVLEPYKKRRKEYLDELFGYPQPTPKPNEK